MLINENDVSMVLRKTDILALIGEHVSLKRVGLRYVGLCPFHSENTPSFSVNAEEGFYYCFGCHVSGDAISFVRAVERLDFVQAVEVLASRAGLTLTYDSDELNKSVTKRSALQSAVNRSVDFYHENLLNSPQAAMAREYLISRGIAQESWLKFKLGWAPDQANALYDYLDIDEKVYVDAGLGFIDQSGKPLDQLRARIIFPIFDVSGKPIAFGGRILPQGEAHGASRQGAKYKNSPETALYSKRKTLYGLHLAKAQVVSEGEIIICEGYTDVIAFFNAGLQRAVASCGTALTEDHFAKIKSFSKRIILAFDADSAGANATEKFYSWERKHKLEIFVADLPPGEDPGDLGKNDPERLRLAVKNALPFMAFRLNHVYDSGDLNSIEGRARLADQAIEIIAEHPNGLVRNDYLMQVADKCRYNTADLHQKLEEALRRKSHENVEVRLSEQKDARPSGLNDTSVDLQARDGRVNAPMSLGLSDRPAIEGLKMLVHNLSELSDFFPPVLFSHPTHRSLRLALIGATEISQAISQVEAVGPEAKELFIRLTVEAPQSDPFDVVSRLVERGVNKKLREMTQEARVLEPNSEQMRHLSEEFVRVRLLQDKLRAGGNEKIDATGQLLFWLVQSAEQEPA